jgi:hypothetical protein
MSGHQIVKIHTHTPRIIMHIHALCLRHRDGSDATHVAVTPGRVFSPHLQSCTRLTLLVTGAGVFAIVRFGHEAGHRVAAGWVDFAGYDTHLGWGCWFVAFGRMVVWEMPERSCCP